MSARFRPTPRPSARTLRGPALARGLSLAPGAICLALLSVWAVHDGGFDADTWYWGALITLALCVGSLLHNPQGWTRLPAVARLALGAFALYVVLSYLSVTWAASPGDALEGSNRTLLYLLVFTLMAIQPWTPRAARGILVLFAVLIGAIGVVLLIRLAGGKNIQGLILDGRLAAPTGYFNSTSALFTMGGLIAVGLSTRRELDPILRGTLLAMAAADLQLAVAGQSRGWLFTLPLVLGLGVLVLRDRLRTVAAAVLPAAVAALAAPELIKIFNDASPAVQRRAAEHAGALALILCALVLAAGSALAIVDRLRPPRRLSRRTRRAVGAALLAAGVLAAIGGATAATHGHPLRFLQRQLNGFTHQSATASGSHFSTVGTSRYDFWRVGLEAFRSHPLAGLGQDNFASFYLTHRRSSENPAWVHSLELRLLVHTGILGLLTFSAFLVLAVAAALRARRARGRGSSAIAGIALLPLIVWTVHGSVDWFWEMPALTGPALAFLGMAVALNVGAGAAGTARSSPGARSPGRGDSPRPQTSVPPAEGGSASAGEPPAIMFGDFPAARRKSRTLPALSRQLGTSLRRGAGRRPKLVRGAAQCGLLGFAAAGTLALGFPYLAVRELSVAADEQNAEPARALAAAREAGRLNPLSAAPGRLGGAIALQAGDFVTARQQFRESITRDPGGWFAWLGAGLAASALGDVALAERDLRRAQRINGQEPAISQALARVATTHPLTPAEDLSLLVRAR